MGLLTRVIGCFTTSGDWRSTSDHSDFMVRLQDGAYRPSSSRPFLLPGSYSREPTSCSTYFLAPCLRRGELGRLLLLLGDGHLSIR